MVAERVVVPVPAWVKPAFPARMELTEAAPVLVAVTPVLVRP